MNKEYVVSFVEKMLNQHWMSPPDRGIIPFLKRKLIPKSKVVQNMPQRLANIVLTTKCNLRCFGCAARGPHWKSVTTKLPEMKKFLNVVRELYPSCQVHLTGGEPTLYEGIEKVAKMIKEFGLDVDMLTNGARRVDLTYFDNVYIDDHGVNREDVKRFSEHCKKYPHLNWGVKDKRWHRDTALVREGIITKGARCESWMRSIMLQEDVIYPCCNMPFIDTWRGGDEIERAFRDAGWHVNNPDVADYVRRWRETVPALAFKVCTLECWKHGKNVGWKNIEDWNRDSVSRA